jgi:hypothetical protein
VYHLNAAKDRGCAVHFLEPEHGPDPPLDSAMILLKSIIQVATLPDSNWLQFPS